MMFLLVFVFFTLLFNAGSTFHILFQFLLQRILPQVFDALSRSSFDRLLNRHLGDRPLVAVPQLGDVAAQPGQACQSLLLPGRQVAGVLHLQVGRGAWAGRGEVVWGDQDVAGGAASALARQHQGGGRLAGARCVKVASCQRVAHGDGKPGVTTCIRLQLRLFSLHLP